MMVTALYKNGDWHIEAEYCGHMFYGTGSIRRIFDELESWRNEIAAEVYEHTRFVELSLVGVKG